MWIRVRASDRCRAWASVLTLTKSTPRVPARISASTEFPPPPPTPMTRIVRSVLRTRSLRSAMRIRTSRRMIAAAIVSWKTRFWRRSMAGRL
jgi:hypothetical protein